MEQWEDYGIPHRGLQYQIRWLPERSTDSVELYHIRATILSSGERKRFRNGKKVTIAKKRFDNNQWQCGGGGTLGQGGYVSSLNTAGLDYVVR